MWSHTVFPAVTTAVIESLRDVRTLETRSTYWQEYIAAAAYVASHLDTLRFPEPPRLYVDLHNRTIGFIFIEQSTADLYYVYRS